MEESEIFVVYVATPEALPESAEMTIWLLKIAKIVILK